MRLCAWCTECTVNTPYNPVMLQTGYTRTHAESEWKTEWTRDYVSCFNSVIIEPNRFGQTPCRHKLVDGFSTVCIVSEDVAAVASAAAAVLFAAKYSSAAVFSDS